MALVNRTPRTDSPVHRSGYRRQASQSIGGLTPTPTTVVFERSGSYASVITAASPALYWRLGASGTTDQSGNGRNGTGQGGITIGGQTGPLALTTDEATNFDGSDDYVSSSYNPFTNGTQRTFTGWVYRDTTGGYDLLLGHSTLDTGFFTVSPSDVPYFSTDNGASNYNFTAYSWPTATWVHFALIFDEVGETASLYINGNLIQTQAVASSWLGGLGNFQIGVGASSNAPWDGKMAEIAVFERALTASEIRQHYNAGAYPPRAVAQSSATFALTASTTVVLATAAAVSIGTLTVYAPKIVPLETAAAVSTATLTLTAPALLTLSTAAATSTATLTLTAKTTITLATAAATSTATLALTAQTYITLGTSAAVSTGTLALTAPAKLTLGTSAAVSTATLTLTAPALLTLSTAAAVSTATLTLTAKTTITLGTSAAVSTATLALSAQARVILTTADGVSTATLVLFAPGIVVLQTAVAISTASLSVTIPTAAADVVLQTSVAISTASLDLTAPSTGGGEAFGMGVLMLVIDDDD